MVYDRKYDDKALNFEASGGLTGASLVMRDRETDSWWGMMRGEALAGPMKGAPLVELPVSSKTTWGEWRSVHPQSLVLSVEGAEHVDRNPYEGYISSDRTFRDLEVDDDRLQPKTPVFAFQREGQAFVISHGRTAGGVAIDLALTVSDAGSPMPALFFYRDPEASLYASTRAYQVTGGMITVSDEGVLVNESSTPLALDTAADWDAFEALPGVSKLEGFDTYWYTWVTANPQTAVLD